MTTLKQIDSKIATFTTNKAKLQTLGHDIAVMVFKHAAPKAVDQSCDGTGDCTRALKLAQAMPNSWATQLEAWFKEFTPIRVVTKNGKCGYDPAYKKLDKEEKLTWWNLESANVTPFYDVIKEPGVAKEFDNSHFQKIIDAEIKRAETAIKEGKAKASEIVVIKANVEVLRSIKLVSLASLAAEASNENKPENVETLPEPVRNARRTGGRVKAA